ncbi:hypothetical protein BELL_0584g00060 [Botrytis elliptica]|uniref:Uncharacterized protein n=1 Tax=Botrytis elliptica TaxID=278938 RepID=A0A4Z1JIN8_9HELO|nr:hypothetical protein EAE99_006230 [Botrytis elliptica]TGO71380.1 hypothetical protein BELL_0584g00060 [Botrytis elliptica]
MQRQSCGFNWNHDGSGKGTDLWLVLMLNTYLLLEATFPMSNALFRVWADSHMGNLHLLAMKWESNLPEMPLNTDRNYPRISCSVFWTGGFFSVFWTGESLNHKNPLYSQRFKDLHIIGAEFITMAQNLSSVLRSQEMEVTGDSNDMTESAHDGLIIIALGLDKNAIAWGMHQPWTILGL